MVRRTNRRRIASGRKVRRTRSRRTTTTPRRTRSNRRTYKFKPWTPYEVKTLRQIFRDTPTKDVAKRLGRSISSVQGKAGDLGLRKSASYMKKMRSSWQ
jgi:FixJ family two-component response regulator